MEQEGHRTSVVYFSETMAMPWLEKGNETYSRSGLNEVGERTDVQPVKAMKYTTNKNMLQAVIY